MNLIICIGNGDEKAASIAKSVADGYGYGFHGFMDSATVLSEGVYHTSIYDINIAELEIQLEKHHVEIVMLDQSESSYSGLYDFEETLKLGEHFRNIYPIRYQNQDMVPWMLDTLKKNKSFCIMPFVNSHQNTVQELSPCCYMKFDSSTPKKTRQELQHLSLQDSKVKECKYCYDLEQRGSSSPRIRWNHEYVSLLGIKTREDLLATDSVRFYHIEIDNQCNLLCRMCSPRWSNLIEKEYRSLGLIARQPTTPRSDDVFKNVDLSTARRILITGGEPTVNESLLCSLEQMAKDGYNDVEVLISTNAAVVSARLKTLIHRLPKLRFGVSIDGFDRVNHYIRWPSDWRKIDNNIKFFYDHARLSHFNTTVSIYNIAHLHDLYQYIDKHFPEVDCFMNLVSEPRHQSPWNHPHKDMIIDDLNKITKLSLYQNKTDFKTQIDGIASKIAQRISVDHDLLQEFFQFNDVLDQSRAVQLKDYVPELASYRTDFGTATA